MKTGRFVIMSMAMMAISHAKTLQVGGRTLEIAEPEGFVEVTPDMPDLFSETRDKVDPDNETLAYFIPAEVAKAAKGGKVPPPAKYFVLKSKGNTEFVAMDKAGFAGLVAGIKSSNQMVTDEMKAQMGESFSPSAVVKLRGVATLPPHMESEVAFAHSILIDSSGLGEDGKTQLMSVTKSYANVAGKVMILYAYGSEDDLEWTRTAVGSWTNAVLAANPKPPTGSTTESAGMDDDGELGGGDLKSGVIGALVGAVLAFLVLRVMRRRAD